MLETVGVTLKLRRLDWAGDDYLLVTTSQTINLGMNYGFKHELADVRAVHINAHEMIEVFDKTNLHETTLGFYGVANFSGRWSGYFGGQPFGQDSANLYRVDLETGEIHQAALGGDTDHDWVVGPDGAVAAHTEYDPRTGAWKLLAGSGSGGRALMSRHMPLDLIGLVGQGRRAGTVLIQDDSGDEDHEFEVSLADGAAVELFADNSIKDYIYDRHTGLLLGAVVDGPQVAVLFDPDLQAKLRGALKAFPGYHASLVSYDPTFDHMVVFTDGGDDSGEYWYVDIATGKALELASARPDIPAAEVGPTRMFAYKAADGLALEGVLTLPPGKPAKGLPLVVMPHGGPLNAHDEVSFDWWAQAFASHGYAVFQPNYRGSGGYGLAFYRAGYGEWGRKILSDIADSVPALAAQGVIDPKRACIVGASYGGYAALAGVTIQHGLYRCAVSYAGVSDLPDLRWFDVDERGDDEMQRYWRTAVQGTDKGAPALAAISPAKHADAADAPILLIHGKDDTVVPIEQSYKMKAALDGAHKPVELIELAGQDHWLTDEATRIQMLKASVAFVEKYDPPN